ncbi:hypothetical protein [Flavobacterium crassostreae]|uniref:Uncharacterized protein n=1 Tax=Flavobacterium crassostreae TaxID=1763534 RepID=A0A1B9E0Q8_9FLAO|nr:hypothetical protein [Flavobacterium crassostreae]OCB75497.1 hypothetical protein LPBF_07795 [Flavobacterium crassostreae]
MKEFKLNQVSKIKTGFSVPENYFEDFAAKITPKLPPNKSSKTRVVSFYANKKHVFAFVAAVVVLALLIPLVLQSTTDNPAPPESITLENYIYYQSSLTQYDLIHGLDLQDLQQLTTSIALPLETQTLEETLLYNDNLENYLLE